MQCVSVSCNALQGNTKSTGNHNHDNTKSNNGICHISTRYFRYLCFSGLHGISRYFGDFLVSVKKPGFSISKISRKLLCMTVCQLGGSNLGPEYKKLEVWSSPVSGQNI